MKFHFKCKILDGVAEFSSEAFLFRFPLEDLPRSIIYPMHTFQYKSRWLTVEKLISSVISPSKSLVYSRLLHSARGKIGKTKRMSNESSDDPKNERKLPPSVLSREPRDRTEGGSLVQLSVSFG